PGPVQRRHVLVQADSHPGGHEFTVPRGSVQCFQPREFRVPEWDRFPRQPFEVQLQRLGRTDYRYVQLLAADPVRAEAAVLISLPLGEAGALRSGEAATN